MADKLADEPDSTKKPMDKSNRLRNNKIALRSCILFEYLEGKSVYKAYKSFCKLVGSDVLEYREFDFWFYKLGKEEIALDSDIEWDPESKSLADMPTEIIKEIFHNHGPLDRLILRKVSQRFRSIIDCSDLGIKSIDCKFSYVQVELGLTNKYEPCEEFCDVDYVDDSDESDYYCAGYCEYETEEIRYTYKQYRESSVNVVECRNREKTLKEELYHERAAKDLTVILKNPKLRLEHFNITFDINNIELRKNEVTYFLSVLKQCSPIHAKEVSVDFHFAHNISDVLSLFQSETLKHISLNMREAVNQSAIIHLEQWKHLKSATLKQELQFPIEHLFHLSSFEVSLESFSVDDAIKIRDILMKSPSFISGKITSYSSNLVDIMKVFDPNYRGKGNIAYNTMGVKFVIQCQHGWNLKFNKV